MVLAHRSFRSLAVNMAAKRIKINMSPPDFSWLQFHDGLRVQPGRGSPRELSRRRNVATRLKKCVGFGLLEKVSIVLITFLTSLENAPRHPQAICCLRRYLLKHSQ